MKRVLSLILVAIFMVQSVQAQAAPSVASVQRDSGQSLEEYFYYRE
jgi:hypothetical protein